MKWRRITEGTGAWLAGVALLLVLMIAFHNRIWILMLTAFALFILCAAAGIQRNRKQEAERREELEQQKELFIRTYNHHRHDWMNDLQVLYGYVKLNKQDRLIAYIEKIRDKMAKESKITKLGNHSLSVYLLSFRARTRSFELDVNIDEHLFGEEAGMDVERLNNAVQMTLRCFEHTVKPSQGEPNAMLMVIERAEEKLLIRFFYTGELSKDELTECFEKTIRQQDHLDSSQVRRFVALEKKAEVEWELPLNT